MMMTIEKITPTPTENATTSVAKYVTRSFNIFPIPSWKVTTVEISDKEMKATFDSLNRSIGLSEQKAKAAQSKADRITSQYNRANALLETTKRKLEDATLEAKKVSKLEADLRTVQSALHETRGNLGRSHTQVSALKRQEAALQASENRLNSKLSTIQKQQEDDKKKWNAQRMKSEEQIDLLERNLNEAQTRQHQLETAFTLVPKMGEIPFGPNSLSQRTGFKFSQKEVEVSHPTMYAEPQPYERPKIDSPLANVRSLCLSKERSNVSKSQDACAFEYRDGRLLIGVADGVSTSHRQSEWAHRCVRSALDDDPCKANKEQRKLHEEHAATFLELEPESTRWMAEAATGKKSDATLMRVEADENNVILQRRGDVWAATFDQSSNEWRTVLAPSSDDGTMAVSSNEALEFSDQLEIAKPDRLLVMTDGLNPTDEEGFELLWNKLYEENSGVFESWLQQAFAGTTFAEDDVTVVAVDFTKEEG
ncbi:MAG: hypothetical protein CMA10_02710 [Euryarchaeota archaeon]|nr:hypothetical protein [Euryarchaeota archaeon]